MSMKYFPIALLCLFMLSLPTLSLAHVGDQVSTASAEGISVDGEDSLVTEQIEDENPLPHFSQITIYVIIAVAGIAVGSMATFILLTMTFHPKK